jgi:hypothetical protein
MRGLSARCRYWLTKVLRLGCRPMCQISIICLKNLRTIPSRALLGNPFGKTAAGPSLEVGKYSRWSAICKWLMALGDCLKATLTAAHSPYPRIITTGAPLPDRPHFQSPRKSRPRGAKKSEHIPPLAAIIYSRYEIAPRHPHFSRKTTRELASSTLPRLHLDHGSAVHAFAPRLHWPAALRLLSAH